MATFVSTKSYGPDLNWFRRYTNGIPISSGTVHSSIRNSTKQVVQKRVKPLDLLHAKTALQHTLDVTTDNVFAGTTGNQVWQNTVAQAANLSKDLNLSNELETANLENRLRNKLKGEMVNLGQMLAEYDKTAQLFGELAGDVASLYRAAKGKGKPKGKPRPPRSGAGKADAASKEAANRLLQFNYGVVPLAMDMTEAIKAVSTAGLRLPVLQASVNHRSYSEKLVKTIYQPVTGLSLDVFSNYSCSRNIKLSAICDLNWGFINSTLAKTGLTNPFSLAYELVPYSFVLDWWINIGDVLASLDNMLFFGTITVQSVERMYWVKSSSCKGANGMFSTRRYIRSAPYTISPINTMAYKPSASLRHILNGTALLRGLL